MGVKKPICNYAGLLQELQSSDVLWIPERQFGITIDGGGSAPAAGFYGRWSAPMAGAITKVRMFAADNVSGSAVIDVWRDSFGNGLSAADSITASAKPTLSSALQSEDTTLTGWTKGFSKGDEFGFALDSASTLTRVTLIITYEAA